MLAEKVFFIALLVCPALCANFSCNCNYSTVWNDVIFLFDASEATTAKGLEELWASAQTILNWFNVQNANYTKSPYHMRVGVIVYASKAQIVSDLGEWDGDQIQDQPTLPFFNGDTGTNIRDAILDGIRQFDGAAHRNSSRRVMILMGTAYDPFHGNTPLQISQIFKESGGIFIVYDYVQTHGSLSPYLEDLSSPGYYFNSVNNTLADIQNALCDANCYCLPNYQSFKDNWRSSPTGGCYRSVETQANFPRAGTLCEESGSVLSFDESPEKAAFLLSQFMSPKDFYIGLSYNNRTDRWEWSDGTALNQDYEPWMEGHEPKPDNQHDCASVTTNLQWVATNCKNGYVYVCQKLPCDSANWCTF